jgi:hypothetical protein
LEKKSNSKDKKLKKTQACGFGPLKKAQAQGLEPQNKTPRACACEISFVFFMALGFF